MGIFDRVFGKKDGSEKNNENLPWIPLESFEQLEMISGLSQERPQVIFKHSNTCGISRVVLKMFKESYDEDWNCDLYFLTIQSRRDISNGIAERFGIRHESPQLLVVKQGAVTFHTSHGGIADTNLGEKL